MHIGSRAVSRVLTALTFGGVLSAAPPALAADDFYALLVGVTTYDNTSIEKLDGPANDVDLMRSALMARGFSAENIRSLTNGSPDGAPTRAHIVEGLEWLAEQDAGTAVVFLAGHGAKQLNGNPTEDPERDGEDEVFLPKDAGTMDSIGAIRNALIDDEIGKYLDAIRKSDTFVVFITDSCFSETQDRATVLVERPLEPAHRYRQADLTKDLNPAELRKYWEATGEASKVARERSNIIENVPLSDSRSDDTAGDIVALYAAGADEKTPEELLPRDGGKTIYGLFSYHVHKALTSYDTLTWRNLMDSVQRDYNNLNVINTKPGKQGALDRVVFGSGTGPRVLQWNVRNDGQGPYIRAGLMHQLTTGSLLALYEDPVARKSSEIIGYAEVGTALLTRSTLKPVDHETHSALAAIPEDVFARLDYSSLSTTLTVAVKKPGDEASPLERMAFEAIEKIMRDSERRFDLQRVDPDQPADLRIHIDDGKVWLLPPSGELVRTGPARSLSVTLPELTQGEADTVEIGVSATRIERQLFKVARTIGLSKIMTLLDDGDLTSDIDLSVTVKRGENAPEAAPSGAISPGASGPTLYAGDILDLTISNTGRHPIDVTVLFASSDYGMKCFFPGFRESNTLSTSDNPIEVDDILIRDETIGPERLFILATNSVANETSDFCYLAQEGVPRGDAASARGTLNNLLSEAGRRGAGRAPKDLAGGLEVGFSVVHRSDIDKDGR